MTSRRQFLGGVGSLGLFSWFEKRCMAVAGVASPTDIQGRLWGVYEGNRGIAANDRLVAISQDRAMAQKMALYWTFDFLVDDNWSNSLEDVSDLRPKEIEQLLEQLRLKYEVRQGSMYLLGRRRPPLKIIQKLLRGLDYRPLNVRLCDEAMSVEAEDLAAFAILKEGKSEELTAAHMDIGNY